MINKPLSHLFLFVLCTLYLVPDALSQSYNFRNYSVEDGLPFVNVSTICQDSTGYLWCGGYGGATCFDGFQFKNFHTSEGLPNNFVSTVAADAHGNVWLGTSKGLALYAHNRFESFTVTNGLPSEKINQVIVDKAGTLWVATTGGLAFKPSGKGFQVLSASLNRNIQTIALKTGGSVYFATGSEVYESDGIIVSSVFNSAVPVKSMLYTDFNHTLLIGTDNSLISYSKSAGNVILFKGFDVKAILEAKDGVIWLGGAKGLYRYTDNKVQNINVGQESNANLISALMQDREGNLWVGTYSGMYRLNNLVFETYSQQSGLQSPFIFGVVRDKNGQLTVGSKDGVYVQKNARFYRAEGMNVFPKVSITDAVRIGNVIWFATPVGLYKYDGQNLQQYGKRSGLISDSVTSLMVDHTGSLWIGQHGGVSQLTSKGFKAYRPDPANFVFDTNCLMEDEEGDIWLGAYQGGLFKISKNKIACINKQLHIPGDAFMALEKDLKGRVYVGTFNGLYIIEKNLRAYTQINEHNGLSSDLIYSMIKDKKGDLWMGTNQGLNELDYALWDTRHAIQLNSYSKEEGFLGVECNSNSTLLDSDGSLWFGTVNGLIHFNPSSLLKAETPLSINLTKVKVDYKDTNLLSGSAISYGHNNISFEFTGFNFSNPHKVHYRWYLRGSDKDWSKSSLLNSTNYSNLLPGSYTFLVKASASNSWNNNPLSFSFTILTPWWRTLWFRLSALGFLTGAVILFFRIRLYQVRKKAKAELKQRVQLSEYRLMALRAQMNPHFIFNSLNSIQNYVMGNEVEAANRYLSKFSRLIRQILNNSERPSISIREEMECLKLYLELEKMRFEEKFSYKIYISPDVDQDFYEVPAMLLQPYVENAILHGLNPLKSKGLLEVSIDVKDDYLVCTVKDNGIGRRRSAELKRKMSNHKSLGMKITHTRLKLLNELHDSDLSVKVTDLEDDQGTQVEVFIPLKTEI